MFGIDVEVLSRPPKKQILTVVLQNFEKSAVFQFVYYNLSKVVNSSISVDITYKHKCNEFILCNFQKKSKHFLLGSILYVLLHLINCIGFI